MTLRQGDIIKNVRYIDEDGWMEGDLNGKRGLFPDNFVKETKNEPKEESSQTSQTSQPSQRRERSSGKNVANLVQRMSTIGFPTGGFQPQPPAAAKKPKKRLCKVLFDYQPQNEDELELKVGDILDITEEVEEGWWSGTMNGKSGLFPSNFVKELDGTGEDGESNDNTTEETDANAVESAATPTSPQPTSGNGVITQPKKIRGVGFGDIFREGSVKLKVRLPSTETEEKKEKPIPSLPPGAKPAHSHMTDLQKVDGDSKSKAKEYCKVLFAFDATNEDELTLKEGETIHILSKDTGEPGWWRGEIGGKEGVFPDNFVTMISDAEKELGQTGEVTFLKAMFRFSAIRPEVPSADKKPHPIKAEDKVDKPGPEHKQSKPAAPLVPPKKPIPPPGKARPTNIPPKRPDKPLVPTPNLKHNGEVPSMRPKSDFEPLLPTKPKTLSGDWGEKSSDTDLMSFDDLSSSSEKLNHPTANRPKMPGRRLPAQFIGGHSSPPPNKSATVSAESKPSSASAPSSDGVSQSSKARTEPEEPASQLEELRSQMKELLVSVELLKSQQTKEIAALREELDEERQRRVALQVTSIPTATHAELSTFITVFSLAKYGCCLFTHEEVKKCTRATQPINKSNDSWTPLLLQCIAFVSVLCPKGHYCCSRSFLLISVL
uniref:SH3 domain-containing protein n=1 Tax=Anabas testudineus TaxID=64144 RepID=A0A7N6BMD9_ANATE